MFIHSNSNGWFTCVYISTFISRLKKNLAYFVTISRIIVHINLTGIPILLTTTWPSLKIKVVLDSVGSSATLQLPEWKWLTFFIHTVPLIFFCYRRKKTEGKKLDSKANPTALNKSRFDYLNPSLFLFKWKNLVLIFKHISFKRLNSQNHPSLSDLQTSEWLLCASLTDFNFDTESNWLHHEKTKGDYPYELDRKKMYPIMRGEKRLIKMSFQLILLPFSKNLDLPDHIGPQAVFDLKADARFVFPEHTQNCTVTEECVVWSVGSSDADIKHWFTNYFHFSKQKQGCGIPQGIKQKILIIIST